MADNPMCAFLRRFPFVSVLAHLRRIEAQNARILAGQQRMENTMSDVLEKLNDLEAKVNAYTTDQGNKIAAAVAAAKSAWDADNQADHDAAIAKIEEISKSLVGFEASGN